MKHIQQKLDTYEKAYVPGERRSKEYEQEIRRQQSLKRRKIKAKNIKYEAKYLTITNNHLEQVNHLIETFNNKFKELHKRASEETIILSFFFYVLKLDNSKININNYRISKKYKLNNHVFSLIISRMLHHYMEIKPISPTSTTDYDQDILYETHGKI